MTDQTTIQPGAIGVDYSWSRPGGANLAAAGVRFVSRYLSHDQRKNMSPAERDDLHAHGIAILLNWELYATRPYAEVDDYGVGLKDGREAGQQAKALGYPVGLAIYASVDTDITNQWADVFAYLRGFAQGALEFGYATDPYGEYELMIRAAETGFTRGGGWQSFAWSPRGPGIQGVRQAPNAEFFQLLGIDDRLDVTGLGGIGAVDENVALRPFNAWLPNGTAPNVPTPTIIDQEDDAMHVVIFNEHTDIGIAAGAKYNRMSGGRERNGYEDNPELAAIIAAGGAITEDQINAVDPYGISYVAKEMFAYRRQLDPAAPVPAIVDLGAVRQAAAAGATDGVTNSVRPLADAVVATKVQIAGVATDIARIGGHFR